MKDVKHVKRLEEQIFKLNELLEKQSTKLKENENIIKSMKQGNQREYI